MLPILSASLRPARAQTDPLPSWNDGATKESITTFVTRVTTQGGPDFVPPAERIATFDNDGTLWCEQPMYVQLAFILDRVKELAPQNPGWKTKQPFKAVLDGDLKAALASGEKGLMRLVAVTHPAVIRAAILVTLDSPPKSFWRIDIGPASRTVMHLRGHVWTLRSTG